MWHWGMSNGLSCLWAAEESAPRNLSQLSLSLGHQARRLILMPSPQASRPPATLDYWEPFVSSLCDLVHSVLSLECSATLSFFTLVSALFSSFKTRFEHSYIWDIWETPSPCTSCRSPSQCTQDTLDTPPPQLMAQDFVTMAAWPLRHKEPKSGSLS